jgi:hypothetical protein
MGERKVLNKFYPPDFDPRRLVKPKNPPERQDKVRMMLPFTVRCSTCGTFLHIGTKFTMRKEYLQEELYLGIKIIRFFFKCSRCATEITMKTDPRNSDYVCESGASRNYDEWRDLDAAEQALAEAKSCENDDPMKFLEARTYESRREMDILDALDEIKQRNKIQANVDYDRLVTTVMELRVKEAEHRAGVDVSAPLNSAVIMRIDEDEADQLVFQQHQKVIGEISLTRKRPAEPTNSRLKLKLTVKKLKT